MKDVVKLIILVVVVCAYTFIIDQSAKKSAYTEDYANCIRFFGSKFTLNDSMTKCTAILDGEMDITDMLERSAD